MSGIYWAYVLHDTQHNSLIRIALSVVRLILELLEASSSFSSSPGVITLILVF